MKYFFSPYNALVSSSSEKKEQAEFILDYLQHEDEIVLDCFAGDGTLASLLCSKGIQVISLEEDFVLFTLMLARFRNDSSSRHLLSPFPVNVLNFNVQQAFKCILLLDSVSYLDDAVLMQSLLRANELLEVGGVIVINGPRFHELRSEHQKNEVFKNVYGNNTLKHFGSSKKLSTLKYKIDFSFVHSFKEIDVVRQDFSYTLHLREPEEFIQILSRFGIYNFTIFADWHKNAFVNDCYSYVIVCQKIGSN